MADITVEVSSPGLVAYGNNSWGSLTYGGDNINIISTGTIDAYNSTGWGRLSWGSLVWGQDFVDVTVSVTTPGTPTTWGYNTWGYGGYDQITGAQIDQGEESLTIGADVPVSTNLINSTVGTVFAAANFIEIPNGVTLNSTVNSVFAGENVIVEVVTPGTFTTWGNSTWNNGAWGQITGILSEVGDETQAGEASVTLSTNLINTTTASLSGILQGTTWGQGTWGSNAWGTTPCFIFGDANVNIIGVQANSAVGTVDHIIDVSVEVTAPGKLPWGYTEWGYGSWGNIGGMDVAQGGEEVVVPSIEVDVIGNQLNTTIGTYTITADANLTLTTNLLTVSLGNEDATPNTIVNLSTNLLTISQGFASGETLSSIAVTGVTVTSQTGRVFISAWAVVDINVTNTWRVVDIAA